MKPGWFIGIGSNIHPEQNVPKILQALVDLFATVYISSAVHTTPVGMASDNTFINLVAYVETHRPQANLTDVLKSIEATLGRARNLKNRKHIDRTADLDPLFYLAQPEQHIEHHAIPTESYLQSTFLELACYLGLIRTDLTPPTNTCRLQLANGVSFGQTATTIHRDHGSGHERVDQ